MDNFEDAKINGLAHLHNRDGIGTLGERSLHAILKYWVDPNNKHHEQTIGIGRIVVDIFDGHRVFEIQTRSFHLLRSKLERVLPFYPVTIIYPIARIKWLIWVDPKTGEATKRRKSPKKGRVWDAFYELYNIREYLSNPNLTISIVNLEIEEYRLLNGWSYDKKKGSHRMERIPISFYETVDLCTATDYSALLPSNMSLPFTSIDLANIINISKSKAGKIVNVMYNAKAIIRIGKRGRAYLYDKPK